LKLNDLQLSSGKANYQQIVVNIMGYLFNIEGY